MRADDDLDREIARLREENERLRRENEALRREIGVPAPLVEGPVSPPAAAPEPLPAPSAEPLGSPPPLPPTTSASPPPVKIALFRSLFRGRDDVYAYRWENERTGRKGYAPARIPNDDRCLPLTDDVIFRHLSGSQTIGVYPLLADDTSWFLACDFDGRTWDLDARAYLAVAAAHGVPAYLERSRSGEGGHAWIFFSCPVAAAAARRLGMILLRETMTLRAEIDLASYDRLFPSQDFLPARGFGNLIALPLQKKCRAHGNTEFLDDALSPYPDQWAFLSGVRRLAPADVDRLLASLPALEAGPGSTRGVRIRAASRRPAPPQIAASLGAGIAIAKSGIPPWLLADLKHLASLPNPDFHRKQKLRLSTYQTPRFVRDYEEDLSHLHLPRGLVEDVRALLDEAGSALALTDERPAREPLDLTFRGELRGEQARAVRAMLASEAGVLVAPPGAGKTVMACALIARRRAPALILVHRKPLIGQWRRQLEETLGLDPKAIGELHGTRDCLTGSIDIAMIQSLWRSDRREEILGPYEHLVIDECHHIPAVRFEEAVRHARPRFVLGLTATPYRRDGLDGIITFQCGPIRYRFSRAPAAAPSLRELVVRETAFRMAGEETAPIQEVFRSMVQDPARNEMICDDIIAALAENRRSLVLSRWKMHCRLIERALAERGKRPLVLEGGIGKKAHARVLDAIASAGPGDEILVLATGSYIGEGFDCADLDTLFLAFPLSFRGSLVQYVGRILRAHEGKRSVRVYDYVDANVSVLARMFAKRQRAYRELGFRPDASREEPLPFG